jgi:hypothetical protein
VALGDLEEAIPVFAGTSRETAGHALTEICGRYRVSPEGLFLSAPGKAGPLDRETPLCSFDYGGLETMFVLGGVAIEEYVFQWEGGEVRAKLPSFLMLTMAAERVAGAAARLAGYAVNGRYLLSGNGPLGALADRKIRFLPAGDIPLVFSPDFGGKVNQTLPLSVRSKEVLANFRPEFPGANIQLFSQESRCDDTEFLFENAVYSPGAPVFRVICTRSYTFGGTFQLESPKSLTFAYAFRDDTLKDAIF